MKQSESQARRAEVLGVEFDILTVDEAADRALALSQGPGGVVVTPNPEIVYLCRKDRQAREAVTRADLVLADGVGILYGAKILGRPLKNRVTGMDFSAALLSRLAQRGESVFLLGAKPGVAEAAGERLAAAHPGLKIAGTHDGYFQEDGPVLTAIRESGAHVVFVCLGAPRQEKWMHDHRAQLPGVLMVGLGGALDVFSGQVRRAPEVFQRLGLEWLYRLMKEPRRIGRMMKLPLFLLLVAGQRLRGGKKETEA